MPASTQQQDQASDQVIAIAATFTAEPVAESLRFWMEQLDIDGEIRFAPYNQVFQQLLDPASILSSTEHGLGVLLVRLEDWWRGASELKDSTEDIRSRVQSHVEDLLAAMDAAAQNSKVPLLLCLCPASPELLAAPDTAEYLAELENHIVSALANTGSVYAVQSADLLAHYPVTDYDDRDADKMGHMPYTRQFFDALGAMIMRRFHGIRHAPAKVIVLDCDNTLWGGICGEDGTLGVRIDPAHEHLQKFLLAQRDMGTLLALCTKNNDADVWAVFDKHPQMVLQSDHIVASRINWQPKSENLRSLADELNLGADSFVFIDDNPVECAEVEARCPQVLTLQLPESEAEVSRLLSHVWAFDHLKVTAEDRQRSELYAQEVRRDQLRKQSLSLDAFLDALELDIDITAMTETELPRVAQLSQRTNQFNFTSVRLTQAELEHRWRSGSLECAVLNLRDRFGDYGLVGAAIYAERSNWIEVFNVLMSCRALGRRVEHRFLAWLDDIATQRNLEGIKIHFAPSQKNRPAREFLSAIGAMSTDTAGLQAFPRGRIGELCNTACRSGPCDDKDASDVIESADAISQEAGLSINRMLKRIATELCDPIQISRAIAAWRPVQRRGDLDYAPPTTAIEESLCGLWASFIGLDKVGVHDNFFALGGQSLIAMQIVFKIQETFGIELALEDFLEAETLADQAEQLELLLIEQVDDTELERLLEELDQPGETGIANMQGAGG